MATSVEDLINQALVGIGYPDRIASIYEGSRASLAGLEIYSQTRDELIATENWPFARRANVALTLLKGPPPAGGYNPIQPWSTTYPPPGWLYEYAYPDDCITLGAVLPKPSFMFDLNPFPAVWRIDIDASLDPVQKVVLTNVKDALAVYTSRNTDISLWESQFIAAFVARMQKKLAVALHDMVASMVEKTAGADEATAEIIADRQPG